MKVDIYNYPKRLDSAVKYVKNSSLSKRNKQIILKFRDNCSLLGIGLPRTVRYIGVLKYLAELLKKDFDKANREDIMRVVGIINEHPKYSAWTKVTYKKILKRFYKWLRDTDESPPEVKWIKADLKRCEKKLPGDGDLLTEQDVKKIIDTANKPRDKAFVSLLYESGCRIGEIASIQIKDVKFDDYGATINVQGKTGSRIIRVISSVPYLATWIQNHNLKHDKTAPLWICIGGKNGNNMMSYSNFRNLLQRLFDTAKIKKRFNPHIFRHSRATFLANHLTEFQMNQYFGWVQGSDMPSTYVHMSGKRIEDSILELHGLKKASGKKQESLKPLVCPRCDTLNPNDNKFCKKCGGFLDLKAAMVIDRHMKKEKEDQEIFNGLIKEMLKDQKFKESFMEKFQEIGLRNN